MPLEAQSRSAPHRWGALAGAICALNGAAASAQDFNSELEYHYTCELKLQQTQNDPGSAPGRARKSRKDSHILVSETGKQIRRAGQPPQETFQFAVSGDGSLNSEKHCECTAGKLDDPQRRWPSHTGLRHYETAKWTYSGARVDRHPTIGATANERGFRLNIGEVKPPRTAIKLNGELTRFCPPPTAACDAPPVVRRLPLIEAGHPPTEMDVYWCDVALMELNAELMQRAARGERVDTLDNLRGEWDPSKPDFATSKTFSYAWKRTGAHSSSGGTCATCRRDDDTVTITLQYTIRSPD